MIDAWDVYWVMQLDAVRVTLIILSTALGIVCTFATLHTFIEEVGFPHLKKLVAVWALLMLAAAFTPSSKTAAAMIVVPALTSEEVVQPVSEEARELYGLAKDALRNLGEKGERK